MLGLGGGGSSDLEGSWQNSATLLILIIAALWMLARRRFSWGCFVGKNKALVCLYVFFLLSACWSDFPVSTIKRILKDFGNVVIAVMLLSGSKPVETIKALFVRVGCLLFPLSGLVNKWFPAIGRNYSVSGEPMVTGVTTQKNELGQMVFVLSVFILFDIFTARGSSDDAWRQRRWGLYLLLGLGGVLLHQCQSKTSLVCVLLTLALFWLSSRFLKMRNPVHGLMLSLCLAGVLFLCDSLLKISGSLLVLLGRDPTLTGRTDIWTIILQQPTNYWLGSGFLSYWGTSAGLNLTQIYHGVKTAHNGYLELFLGGGVIGVVLLVVMLLSRARFTWRRMVEEKTAFSILGFSFCAMISIYNVSESGFFFLTPLWFAFLLLTIELPSASETFDDRLIAERASGV
jgi:O-antigen ligase